MRGRDFYSRIGRSNIGPSEFGYVGSRRKLDANRIGCAVSGVIKSQASADFAGFHPDRGIVTRFVAGGAPKNVDADRPLLEHVGSAGKGVFDHVADKILAALARAELVAGQDARQLLAHLLFRGPRAVPPVRRLGGRLALRHRWVCLVRF